MRLSRLALPLLATLFCASGATCPQVVNTYGVSQPRILPPTATVNDVITTINNNTAKIQSLATDDASISVPSTVKCSLESRPWAPACSTTALKKPCATSPTSSPSASR